MNMIEFHFASFSFGVGLGCFGMMVLAVVLRLREKLEEVKEELESQKREKRLQKRLDSY